MIKTKEYFVCDICRKEINERYYCVRVSAWIGHFCDEMCLVKYLMNGTTPNIDVKYEEGNVS